VHHDHGLNNGTNQIRRTGGVPVMSDTRKHQRNALRAFFESKIHSSVWNEDLDAHRRQLRRSPANNKTISNINGEKYVRQKHYASCVVIGGHAAGLMQSVFLTASNDSML
jgi:hypothetical protein